MLSIGDLARHTRVSVRMLRHYDALGLVTPRRVDPSTGYRRYSVSQIGRVNSLQALKALGFSLAQCRDLLDEELSAERLRQMLLLRQSELEQQIKSDTDRLTEVGKRLRSIERGLTMTDRTFELQPLPAMRLVQVSTEVNDTSEIGEAVGPLFEDLRRKLIGAGVAVEGHGVRTYYGRPDGSVIDVAAAMPLDADLGPVDGAEIAELGAEKIGASATFRGQTDIGDAWLAMDVALEERGLESHGVYRQVYRETPPDRDQWVVELQCPVRPAGSCDDI